MQPCLFPYQSSLSMSGMTLNAGADVVAKAGQDGLLPSPIPPGPPGESFCLLRPHVCDCKSMQHLVAGASSVCSFSPPLTSVRRQPDVGS